MAWLSLQASIGISNVVPATADDEIIALRSRADLYVFPSLKEGFSLTPLEAQSYSLPCVISDIPCHREVYGDSVMYFNPNKTTDIAESINVVLADSKLQKQLINKGLENVKKYNWRNTALDTLKIFNEALEN